LKERGFELLDTQWVTPHLATFGAVEIPQIDYLHQLAKATSSPVSFTDPTPRVA
jgi:leucyl/phenylalanyl-tRNA--protein transferase